MRVSRTPALLTIAIIAATAGPASGQRPAVPDLFSELRFRSIGPAVTGGRVHDVEALPHDPATVYVASASGGIWKSTNKGTTWRPIFDDQAVSSLGDLAIAPSDPDVLWAGTGGQNNRQSTSWGNGVYRSTDGGESWAHLGLEETRHIARVVVHPRDPDVAYVAAQGNLWAPSEARGVYRTTDGGASWDRVLYVDTLTGATDLVMDPDDPGTLYAATYQRLRRTWGFNGGGPGSGIYKTTDGGETWTELTHGIPAGDKGRIGLAIAPTDGRILYALIQHETESGVYRTGDGGTQWSKVHDRNIRPMYYSHIFVDPGDPDRVYTLATRSHRSEDGGRSWTDISARPTYDVGLHSDHHTMWIDPRDPDHFYLAGDAGLHESWDRGESYVRLNNFVIGQFYAIGVDMRDPYRVYGGMQDNHSWMGPNTTRHWIGIINDDWRQIGFGDGMYQRPDPTTHRYVYSNSQNGGYTRVDAETGDLMDIEPIPPEDEEYRFDWVSPSLVSSHDPQTVYVGGNRLFVSRDRGESWTPTEDLTRAADRDTLRLMGVPGAEITLSPNDGTSSFGEITTIAESPLSPDILWVGTDDGNIQLSRDGGETWTEVGRNLPAPHGTADDDGSATLGTYVSRIVASAAGRGRAYATLDAHRDGDFRPYVYRTDDFGASWVPLVAGLEHAGSANVLVEHPDDPQLLFLGTEHALWISLDAGAGWQRFGANLPTTLYDDLVIHPRDDDLVVGTHGRGIWILDDLRPLTAWSPSVAGDAAHLFAVADATIFQFWKDTSYRGQAAYAGENAPFGALITYHLAEPADARIEIETEAGETVRSFPVPGADGVLHRVTWDLRHPAAPGPDAERAEEGLPRPIGPRGPFVSPGLYTVTLVAGDARRSRPLVVRGDPELPLTDRQYRERERFLLEVGALQRRVWRAAQDAEAARRELEARRDSLSAVGAPPEDLPGRIDTLHSLHERLDALREDLESLTEAFTGSAVRQGTLYPPTETQRRRRDRLERRLDEALDELGRARDR